MTRNLMCLIVLGFGLAPGAALAETNFPTGGELEGDVTWNAAGSPYFLGDTVSLAEDATLTIEGGTIVEGADDASLVALEPGSKIVVRGRSGDPAIFRGRNGVRWEGIHVWVGSDDPPSFEHMEMHDAYYALSIRGVDDFAPVSITDCLFVNNVQPVSSAGGTVHIDRSVFRDGTNGVIGGLLSSPANKEITIANSVFYRLSAYAVRVGSDQTRIVNSTFGYIGRIAVSALEGTTEVKNTVIMEARDGFSVGDSATLDVSTVHVYLTEDIGISAGRVSQGDPLFLDAEAGIFVPTDKSPLVDTGLPDPLSRLDLVGTARPAINGYDIGAIELRSICGDGEMDGDETCDDGNLLDGDGCNSRCVSAACGNGLMDPGEECDDGNSSNDDACLNNCRDATCGDGYVARGFEECDDGNLSDRDGCLRTCEFPRCGDGVINGAETCDDGNLIDGDGCPNTCGIPDLRSNPGSGGGCAVGMMHERAPLAWLALGLLCGVVRRRTG